MAVRGAVLVALSPRVSVGGAGTYVPADVDVPGDAIFPDRGLGFGYGGVLVEVRLPSPARSVDWAAGGLVGAGNADLRDRGTGTRLASENMIVLEPSLAIRRNVASRVAVGLSFSWRAVLGLGEVEGVAVGDLATPFLGLHLRVGPL